MRVCPPVNVVSLWMWKNGCTEWLAAVHRLIALAIWAVDVPENVLSARSRLLNNHKAIRWVLGI